MSLPANRKHRLCRTSPPTKRMKLTERVTCIDDLPPEMICELFKHLHPKDLATCSMVNRRWHSIYASFKVHKLVASDRFLMLSHWHGSDQIVLETERCNLNTIAHLVKKALFSNLKQLAVCGVLRKFDLNKLNRFRQLLHLEIDITCSDEVRVNLNLPRLKVLIFSYFGHHVLSIDCPLLSTLLFNERLRYSGDLLKVKHPETIRKLHTDMVGHRLAPFKNVECLVTENFEAISKATLLSLPGLRELHYNEHIEAVFEEQSYGGPGAVDRVKRTLSEFLNEAEKSRGGHFRFRFAGLQLANVNVDQIDFVLQADDERFAEDSPFNECVYMKNYQLIEPDAIPFVQLIDYNRLLRHTTGEFPRCFSEKFTGIDLVHATGGVKDPDQFLWFLKSLRSRPTILELSDTGFGQEFYDQLPESAPSLNRLELTDGHCEDGLQVNFDFIERLSRLSSLYIEPFLSLESLLSLVRSLGELESGSFGVKSRGEYFCIRKRWNSTKWNVEQDRQSLFETENVKEIANFFEGLHDDTSESSYDSE